MPTCIHRVYSDPDRDNYTYGVSCGKDAVAYSIHPGTGEKLFWCAKHTGNFGQDETFDIEDDRQSTDQEKVSLEVALRIAEEAFEAAIDRDAPDETVRRLERIRDDAAHRLQMVGRAIR